MRKRCAIVLPVYNEIQSLAAVLSDLRAVTAAIAGWEFSIYCVDDGSTDGTADLLAQAAGVTTFTHSVNLGYGAALKTALRKIDEEWIFIMDADGSYPAGELSRLLDRVRPEVAMVVAERAGAGIEGEPYRRIARWLLRLLVKGLAGFSVSDLNSGMRLFRRHLYLEFQHLLPRGFSFTSTITLASLYRAYPIDFVRIEYRSRVGKSHIRPVRDFFSFALLIVRATVYFEPLRLFNPASAAGVGLSVGCLAFEMPGLAIFFLLASIQLFLAGLMGDLIVRRARSVSLAMEMG